MIIGITAMHWPTATQVCTTVQLDADNLMGEIISWQVNYFTHDCKHIVATVSGTDLDELERAKQRIRSVR